MKPDNALVTWNCCGNRWELILTRLHPERDMFQPLCQSCGKQLRPALAQLKRQREVAELLSDFALLRLALKRTNERNREAQAREGLG